MHCSSEFFFTTPIAWLIIRESVVIFYQNEPGISNQPVVFFSQNELAPATIQMNMLVQLGV
jgi:hypothetical protein